MEGGKRMSTVVRPELSKSNALYISKHRYYELKHFCLQYPEWQKKCRYLNSSSVIKPGEVGRDDSDIYRDQMRLVDECINEAAEEWLRPYLRYYVIYGETYPELKTRRNIPCGKDIFYNAFRRFLYILSERR